MTKQCLQCNKVFKKSSHIGIDAWNKVKFCSQRCHYDSMKGYTPWNKGMKYTKAMRARLDISGLKDGIKYRKHWPQNEEHLAWKGEKVGYVGLHAWVQRKLGKPKQCEHCKEIIKNTYHIHWANKSGNYKRDLADWLRLCRWCHEKYDSRLVMANN